MPVKTRLNRYQTPPPNKYNAGVRTSRKTVRFYDAWDKRSPTRSLCALEREFGLAHPQGQRWLDQRSSFGSPSYHCIYTLSNNLGRRSKVLKETCQMLVSLSRNPVHNQLYEAQIEYYKLPIKRGQLQRKLKEHTKGGQWYK
jgi:hypothetical protein